MNQAKSDKLKCQVVLDEFLELREWTDEYKVDDEEQSVFLKTEIKITEGHSGNLIIEASDKTDCYDVFIYLGIACKENKLDELAVLFNLLHRRWSFGRFMFFESGNIRWAHRVDFEGSTPTGTSLNRIVAPGWAALEEFADVIASVALTKQSALDALQEYDDEKNSNSD